LCSQIQTELGGDTELGGIQEKKEGKDGDAEQDAKEDGDKPAEKPAAKDEKAAKAADKSKEDDAASKKRKADSLAADTDVTASLHRSIKRHRAAAEVLMASGKAAAGGDDRPPYAEPVLLAGRFFDEKLAGYIEEKDLEDIVHLTQRLTCRRWVQGTVEASTRRGRLRCEPHSACVRYIIALRVVFLQ
jgi:hypothetical protein